MSPTTSEGHRFDLEGIGHILQDNQLAVPIYQRPYSWQAEQVTDFLKDLEVALGAPDAQYFLGTIVATPDENSGRLNVIDGQQRLATATILLAAIRDAYADRGEADRAGIVHQNFIASQLLETRSQEPQLCLNTDDDTYFRTRVTTFPLPPSLSGTAARTRIKAAYDLAADHVRDMITSSGGRWADELVKWVRFIQDKVRVIFVRVPNEADAFLIFETLNDRGLDLTIADLLKNYLFSQAGARLATVQQAWTAAVATLDISSENELFVTFLRHYWSSRYGLTRERDLYKSFKNNINSEQQAVDFAADIRSSSRFYAAILSSDHEVWSTLGTVTRRA